jgi:ferric-dicitrate binding protein FerR (iron transport regulator)
VVLRRLVGWWRQRPLEFRDMRLRQVCEDLPLTSREFGQRTVEDLRE